MIHDDTSLDAQDNGLEVIEAGGETRVLGHVPSVRWRNVSAYPFGSVPIVPRDQWQEFDVAEEFPDFRKHIDILDQNGIGACNGHAACTSLKGARLLAGLTPVKLSAFKIYADLCQGHDVGSNIGDALRYLQSKGTCRFEAFPWKCYDPRKITPENVAESLNYRIQIGHPVTSFDEIMSLVQLRIFGNFSVRVGGRFNDLDADGSPPVAPGPGNHTVAWRPAAKRDRNCKWMIGMDNSWADWGLNGTCWIREEHINRQSYFEGYGIFAPIWTPGDPLNPPMAV